MHEILHSLSSSARVLDLGCDRRSFDAACTAARVIRVDREIHFRDANELMVQADARRLPFADHSITTIVSNHSLEHFDDLDGALAEIRRVISQQGSLYVAVPDASTFCDKLYRWLSKGGGHVNAFTSPDAVVQRIELVTGLPHVATTILYTSLSFLHQSNSPRPRPRRLLLLGGGREWSLFLFAWLSRLLDRRFGTRLSVYGWAFYFGTLPDGMNTAAQVNVCLKCGSGNPSALLRQNPMAGLVRQYNCPQCGTRNPFSDIGDN